jgi:hypothetical protein
VSASQIELRGTSPKQAQFYSVLNNDYEVTATAKNKSKYNVTGLRSKITAFDSPTQEVRGDCDVIGRGLGVFDTSIPADEARHIAGKVEMPNVAKPAGVFSVRFTVVGVRAALDMSDEAPKLPRDWLYEMAHPYKCNHEQ